MLEQWTYEHGKKIGLSVGEAETIYELKYLNIQISKCLDAHDAAMWCSASQSPCTKHEQWTRRVCKEKLNVGLAMWCSALGCSHSAKPCEQWTRVWEKDWHAIPQSCLPEQLVVHTTCMIELASHYRFLRLPPSHTCYCERLGMPWEHGTHWQEIREDITDLHVRCNAIIQKVETLERKVEKYQHEMQQKTNRLAHLVTILGLLLIAIQFSINWNAVLSCFDFKTSSTQLI